MPFEFHPLLHFSTRYVCTVCQVIPTKASDIKVQLLRKMKKLLTFNNLSTIKSTLSHGHLHLVHKY